MTTHKPYFPEGVGVLTEATDKKARYNQLVREVDEHMLNKGKRTTMLIILFLICFFTPIIGLTWLYFIFLGIYLIAKRSEILSKIQERTMLAIEIKMGNT